MTRQLSRRVGLACLVALFAAGPLLAGELKPVDKGTEAVGNYSRYVNLSPAPKDAGLTWSKAMVGTLGKSKIKVALDAATADAEIPSVTKITVGDKTVSIPVTFTDRSYVSRGKTFTYKKGSGSKMVSETIQGKAVPVAYVVNCYLSKGETPDLDIARCVSMEAKVQFGDQAGTVHFVDANCNFKLSRHESMKASVGKTSVEIVPNRPANIAGKLFRVNFDAKTNIVTAKAYEGEQGKVTSKLLKYSYILASKTLGTHWVTEKTGTMALPAGEYKISQYTLTVDKSGLIVEGYDATPMTVAANKITMLPMPESITATLSAKLRKGSVTISLKMTDSIGGQGVEFVKNNDYVNLSFEVVDSENKVVYTNSLEYG
ncbi:MAG: hypothetical protein HN909_06630 [Phycisphaerales bacterium]|nr:hypothetical protein [Phycisphaerales bacterium]MBT7171429.1 hypothetical protein [Phycisphaerales bacterium]